MSELSDYTASLTPEQQAHVAQLRSKFFRWVSIISVIGTILLLIILRFTVYNYKNVEDYEQYVTHKDSFMRFNAAKALGQFENNPKAIVLLSQMLNDSSVQVKWHAGLSLAKLKNPKSIQPLLRFIEKEKDISSKSIGIYALGQTKSETILDPLKKEFEKSLLIKDVKKIKDERINQFSIIQSFAYVNTKKSNDFLEEVKNRNGLDKELKDFTSKMLEVHGIQIENKKIN